MNNMNCVVNECPVIKFDGGLLRPYKAEEINAVNWLKITGAKTLV